MLNATRLPNSLSLRRLSTEERCDQLSHVLRGLGVRFDANETAAFARQLEQIETRLREVLYPAGHGTELIPLNTAIDRGALTHTYRVMDYAGRAKRVSNWGTDFPRIDLQGKEVTHRLQNYGVSFGYNLQQLWSSQFANFGLEQRLGDGARAIVGRYLDENLFVGDADIGVTGFANNANVDLVSADFGDWTTATPEQILADLQKLVNYIPGNTNGVETADSLVLPVPSYNIVATKFFSTTMPLTVLEMFKKANPGVAVYSSYRLNLADAAGTGPRAIAYRNDPMKLSGLVPVEFMILPAIDLGGEFEVKCLLRCGGVSVEYPDSLAYMDGIGAP